MMLNALGYSTVSCISLPVEIGLMLAGCDYGTIGEIYYLGVANSKDSTNFMDQCSVNETNKACEPNSSFVDKAKSDAIG